MNKSCIAAALISAFAFTASAAPLKSFWNTFIA